MPKVLFYLGTAFSLLAALSSADAALEALRRGSQSFVAAGADGPQVGGWAIVVALLAGASIALLFLRMASLVAARNLFAAFVALFAVTASMASLVWLLMLQVRMLATAAVVPMIGELHLAGVLMLAWFVAMAMLALHPYFRVQASRTLSILVFLPLPLVLIVLGQELFVSGSPGPMPSGSPALAALLAILAFLFFAIAVHSVRHRYLFLEMTNLREILEPRVNPGRGPRRPIGGVAFDS